jgi:hypothetical protein
MRAAAPKPTRQQVVAAQAICAWYLSLYHDTPADLGVPATFMAHELVGEFAISPEEFRTGASPALFRLLVATTMFQRRQDQQVLRILRGMSRDQVSELTSPRRLVSLAEQCACPRARSQATLISECDLYKDDLRRGTCRAAPQVECHLKRHAVWLKRYGHFGKVPTSAALMLQEAGARTVSDLYRSCLKNHDSPRDRAQALEATLSNTWRVSQKIAAMFLSVLSNPDLGSVSPPFRDLDWTYFVVIDSNTDLFLRSIRYVGPWTYAARREFIWGLAAQIDLSKHKSTVSPYNPRIVQQAAYVFMSRSNRRASLRDCWRIGPGNCSRCPQPLRTRCPARRR